MAKKVTFYIPLKDNQGNTRPQAQVAILDAIERNFNGYSAQAASLGAWYSPSEQKWVREPVRAVVVIVDPRYDTWLTPSRLNDKIQEVAHVIKRALDQKSVLVTTEEVDTYWIT